MRGLRYRCKLPAIEVTVQVGCTDIPPTGNAGQDVDDRG
jgi:hypothetical protein